MPVTAKLSRKFYDRLGDDIANELVAWFNAVDETYRQDLRELNELNFSRFDAKMGQRLAEYDSKLDRRFAEFEVKLEHRLAEFEVRMEQRFAESQVKMEQRFAELEAKMNSQRVNLIKWMVVCWAGTVIPILGTVVALAQ